MQLIISEFYRLIISKRILLSVFLIFVVCILCLCDNFELLFNNDGQDLIYMYNLLMDLGSFKNMIILFSAGTCSTLFCEDWNDRFLNNIIVRTNIKKYAISKFIVASIITFITSFTGIVIFILFLSQFIPIYNGYSINETFENPYGHLITSKFPIAYILIKTANLCISCSFWSLSGITFSVFNPNKLMSLFSPFAGYYLLSEFSELFPIFINIRTITYSYDIINSSLVPTLIYTFAFWMILSTILLYIFIKNLERRQNNELC